MAKPIDLVPRLPRFLSPPLFICEHAGLGTAINPCRFIVRDSEIGVRKVDYQLRYHPSETFNRAIGQRRLVTSSSGFDHAEILTYLGQGRS